MNQKKLVIVFLLLLSLSGIPVVYGGLIGGPPPPQPVYHVYAGQVRVFSPVFVLRMRSWVMIKADQVECYSGSKLFNFQFKGKLITLCNLDFIDHETFKDILYYMIFLGKTLINETIELFEREGIEKDKIIELLKGIKYLT